jgi:outer membrane protein assembly factor BamB
MGGPFPGRRGRVHEGALPRRHLIDALPATPFRGSLDRIDPTTGAITWQTGLPNGVLTSPSINGGGVIAVGTYDNSGVPNQTYVFSASDGALLAQLDQGEDFPQSAFAHGWLYTASSTGLYAWAP